MLVSEHWAEWQVLGQLLKNMPRDENECQIDTIFSGLIPDTERLNYLRRFSCYRKATGKIPLINIILLVVMLS